MQHDEYIAKQLSRIENRVDEVYDRVSLLGKEMFLLKWKIGTISSAIGAAVGSMITYFVGRFH